MMRKSIVFAVGFIILISCKTEKKPEQESVTIKTVSVPRFNADSAYSFVEKQVKFGPRVPNTKAHDLAADYLIGRLKENNAQVTTQDFEAITWDNQKVKLKNIVATYNPEAQKRILLAAHWDTRPYADKDKENKGAAMDGANDGASGTGVLLEIARNLNATKPAVGIDLIFFDGEDWGEGESGQSTIAMPAGYESWWCLGSQYWAKHKHKKNYSAYYGILLDMVGSRRAQFFKEGVSLEYAPAIIEKVWGTAARLGYTDYFVSTNAASITDDHLFVNEMGKIPMIDIVHYQAGVGYFGDYHHSTKDNLSIISKETLSAVGNTVLNVIYNE